MKIQVKNKTTENSVRKNPRKEAFPNLKFFFLRCVCPSLRIVPKVVPYAVDGVLDLLQAVGKVRNFLACKIKLRREKYASY